jgi:transglutaminase-like putative cysteine protease
MPKLYKYLTAALALIGCASLLITGETNPVMSVSGLALLPGYWRFLKGEPAAGRWTIGTLALVALGVFFFDAAIVSGDVVVAVAHLTIAFQAIKSFDLKEPWDNLQVFFVSLLQLVIASELTDSIVFGLVFAAFIVLLVTAMILSHFIKEGFSDLQEIKRPLIIISLLTIFVTLCIFIALPRASVRMFGRSHVRGMKATGFSNDMDFGAFGRVKLDPTVVMRIEMNGAPDIPYYWRGTTFDYFDGIAWRNSLAGLRRRRYRPPGSREYLLSPYNRSKAIEQKIFREPMDSDVLFGLSRVEAVVTDSFALVTDSASCIYLPRTASRSIEYTVYSVPSESYRGVAGPRYLQLPGGIERIGQLARRVTAGAATPAEKTAEIERYLRRNYTYSLTTFRPANGMSPIEDFLFHSKKGYCEHYATSMVLMLRFLGIPARIVNGFHGGEKNRYGGYVIVRESDAHSWVEAYIDGRWTRFDPTPAVAAGRPSSFSLLLDSLKMNWSRYVIAFSSKDQLSLLRAVSFPFALPATHLPGLRHIRMGTTALFIVLAALVCCAVWLLARLVRPRRYGFVTRRYMEMRRTLKKKGAPVSPASTAGDLLAEARQRQWKKAEEFLLLYEEARFGKKVMGTPLKSRYEKLLREARKEK